MKIFTLSLFILTSVILQTSVAYAGVEDIRLVSKSNADVFGDDASGDGILAIDGDFIVFSSNATNIVGDDTNAVGDIFVYDIQGDSVERVSVDDLGNEGDDASFDADISADGRYIVFTSSATNLVAGDTNGFDDIFLYDRNTDTIELISLDASDGLANDSSEYPSISSNGRYIVFASSATDLVAGDSNVKKDIFMRDTLLDTTERISLTDLEAQGNDDSESSAISLDGRYVVFMSQSTNLVTGDTNAIGDLFIRDTTLDTTERLTVSSSEQEANDSIGNLTKRSVSSDGRYVTFGSLATNLVTGDTNGTEDIFVRDRTLGTTERITLDPSGDQIAGLSTIIVTGISSSGRYISFYSDSDQFITGDTNAVDDVFVRDTTLDTTRRVSMSVSGDEGNGQSEGSVVSFAEGGRYIVFSSKATNFVDDDTNGVGDIFYVEIKDDDGVVSSVEDASPNNGDVDEDGYDDSIEEHITSFVNPVSGNYSTVETTGDCISNSNPAAVAESSLASQDSSYDYPLGIISFEVGCKNAGETATVSVYCFCEVTSVDGTLARKYDEDTGVYTTIESAVIEEVTVDGQRALKMTYDVVDGGSLDEDGLENGTIIDPVGFARVVTSSSSGGSSSSGSRPIKNIIAQNTNEVTPITTPTEVKVCTKQTFTTSMKKGSKYGEVSKLQELLNKSNFNVGVADGLFGPMTHKGVQIFQTANSLASDGIVGPMTRVVLNSVCI